MLVNTGAKRPREVDEPTDESPRKRVKFSRAESEEPVVEHEGARSSSLDQSTSCDVTIENWGLANNSAGQALEDMRLVEEIEMMERGLSRYQERGSVNNTVESAEDKRLADQMDLMEMGYLPRSEQCDTESNEADMMAWEPWGTGMMFGDQIYTPPVIQDQIVRSVPAVSREFRVGFQKEDRFPWPHDYTVNYMIYFT